MSRHSFIDNQIAALDGRNSVEWLAEFQEAAKQRFIENDVPGRKAEEWRFFDLRPIVDTAWSSAESTASFDLSFADEAGTRVTLAGGARLSVEGDALPDGAYVGGLADLPAELQGTVADAIGSAVRPYEDDPFCALNSAAFSDIVTIVVPRDTSVDAPIHVVFAAPGDEEFHCPRLLVVAGSGSKFTVVEDFQSAETTHFTNAVSEFIVGESANVHHVRVQRENRQAKHVGRIAARVGEYGKYDSVHVTLGAAASRNDVWVTHEGADGWSRLDGLAMVDGDAETDTHTVIDNTRPRCESHQLHKCVVDDKAHAVFNGKIFVRQDAQKIDAYQLNRNLLLSRKASVDTKPQLEIFADDVQCTHGATVGQLDDDQLFYLQSRGLAEDDAKATLTYAFAAEVIDSIRVPSLAATLEDTARQRTMRNR